MGYLSSSCLSFLLFLLLFVYTLIMSVYYHNKYMGDDDDNMVLADILSLKISKENKVMVSIEHKINVLISYIYIYIYSVTLSRTGVNNIVLGYIKTRINDKSSYKQA